MTTTTALVTKPMSRAGDIGRPIRHIELEPVTAPATTPAPEPAPAPATVPAEPEKVPA